MTYPAYRDVFGLTYSAGALIRIDYIWHSTEFQAVDAQVWYDSGTSDHYPVVATLIQ